MIMEEEKLDLISGLPDEILRHIFSFLPLKMAVRTSILSIAWRRLWKAGLYHGTEEDVMRVISKFMGSYKGLILRFPSTDKSSNKQKKSIILATMGADELHLEFSDQQQVMTYFDLNWELTCPNLSRSPILTAGIFASLKSLHLRSISHLAQNMDLAFFSNCQLLESLELVKCSGLQCLHINADNRLKNLKVLDCPNMVNVILCAPNLLCFRYRGVLPQFHLKNISHLIDVRLDFNDGPGSSEFDCEELLSLLAHIAHVEILTLSGWLLEWLCSAGVIFGRLSFQFNNLKEMWWIDCLIDRPKRDSISCFLRICPFLEKLFIDIDRKRTRNSCPLFHYYWHEPHLCMDYKTVNANASRLDHLRVIKITGFTNHQEELLLVDHLLQKAVFLKSMVVTSPENQSWRVVKVPYSQLKQQSWVNPKHILESQEIKSCCVYVEEDSSDLRTAHFQMS